MSLEHRLFDRLPTPTLQWLWPNRIPRGCLTLIVGQPGIGKSLLAVDLAARLSAARPWPDEQPPDQYAARQCGAPELGQQPPPSDQYPARQCGAAPSDQYSARQCGLASPPPPERQEWVPVIHFLGTRPPKTRPLEAQNAKPDVAAPRATSDFGSHTPESELPTSDFRPSPMDAIFVRPEDDPATVLRPRLSAAGADLARISIAENGPDDRGLFVLPDYLYQLVPAVRALDAPALVIFDPLTAVLPSGPAATNALSHLIDFARRHNVAIVGITHLSKQSAQRPLYRVNGPVSLIAAARAVYLVSPDPDDRDRRLVSQLKTVYGPPTAPLAFHIRSGPHLEWQPPSDPVIPHAAHVPPDLCDLSADAHSALTEACAWLADYLADGPRLAAQLLRDARNAGLSVRTLHRAKRLLAARSFKSAAGDGWCWTADQHSRLPNQPLEFGNLGKLQPTAPQA
jgi:hypothetical protein